MQREILDQLLAWRAKPHRKPLLIDGARQTGKTYLLQELLGPHFERVIRIDFLETPSAHLIFEGDLSPQTLIENIELSLGVSITPKADLLILDEIGECPRALTSLKYFAERAPHWFIAASGSNIGLLNAFPVGKVEQYVLRPLSFSEFVLASGDPSVIRAYEREMTSSVAHEKLFDLLTDYYFVGGMPEAVQAWFHQPELSKVDRVSAVRAIQTDLIAGYIRDFGKYSSKGDAHLIESVFTSIPAQLSATRDESVKRFRFKGVHQRKSRYTDFESSITWLHRCRLALKNYVIEGRPRSPLSAYQRENRVKLFLFDTGLLQAMLGVSYREIKLQGYEYKGYVAENFVQQELAALGLEPSFSWVDARAEVEFLLSTELGEVIPLEVKSGKRTQAKSLRSYVQKCQPHKTLKLIGARVEQLKDEPQMTIPLYYVKVLKRTLQADERD